MVPFIALVPSLPSPSLSPFPGQLLLVAIDTYSRQIDTIPGTLPEFSFRGVCESRRGVAPRIALIAWKFALAK